MTEVGMLKGCLKKTKLSEHKTLYAKLKRRSLILAREKKVNTLGKKFILLLRTVMFILNYQKIIWSRTFKQLSI